MTEDTSAAAGKRPHRIIVPVLLVLVTSSGRAFIPSNPEPNGRRTKLSSNRRSIAERSVMSSPKGDGRRTIVISCTSN